jgi:hypothetical protein
MLSHPSAARKPGDIPWDTLSELDTDTDTDAGAKRRREDGKAADTESD